ncbi:MAG: OmpA family protein [Lachnospiraceae bacterium]|nr:OmpA family protein [Lachnospiraceae bacterium]
MVDVKESIFFAFGSSKIASKKEQMNIEAYAKAAAEAGAKLRVIGYTDTIGSEEYNKGLAEARANAVAEVLKAAGVEDVEVVAVGETDELSSKYLNRRAVIEIVK